MSEIDWKAESRRFDGVAGPYHTYRPGYPTALIDAIVERTGLTESSRILEVGSGTGKATELFARRGYSIHCIEPGVNLMALAAHNLQRFFQVSFSLTDFERWPLHIAGFDLVVSAQAFHWIAPHVKYAKAASALKADGHIALFWNFHPVPAEPVFAALDAVYRDRAPDMAKPVPWQTTAKERKKELVDSGYFTDVVDLHFPWKQTYTTTQYIGLLTTYSDHLRLPDEQRQNLFNGITEVIDQHGGSLEKPYETVVLLGTKIKR